MGGIGFRKGMIGGEKKGKKEQKKKNEEKGKGKRKDTESIKTSRHPDRKRNQKSRMIESWNQESEASPELVQFFNYLLLFFFLYDFILDLTFCLCSCDCCTTWHKEEGSSTPTYSSRSCLLSALSVCGAV